MQRWPRPARPIQRSRTETILLFGLWGALGLFLAAAFLDMILCEVEEKTKPAEICTFCWWRSAHPDEFRPGCSGEFGPANRICPTCNREWGAYHPYYLKWFRDPIRSRFGRFQF